ncbi:RNA-binding protein 44 isoform X4 [Acanthopagrus latus]|uniref:RNA-binding protein 44 isoform X4 n=1 Tax=Acanthopagrus latus TaxID=8177 RepID=UPI00187C75BA|nr:RNA-binding protein 44 isoform X4 [Acanthopagrus latus]
MELYYVVNPDHCSFPYWLTVPDTDASTVFKTTWPAHPCSVPYDVTVASTSYGAGGYAGVVEPPQVIPHFYSTVAKRSRRRREDRELFLDRSVFNLVYTHRCLALTDPKLLGWYLSLSPEDRKIIQDKGGFHHFLQGHPGLKLSRRHVYVKNYSGRTGSARPFLEINNHTSKMLGATRCRCGIMQNCYTSPEVAHSHLDLEMCPNDVRGTLLGYGNSMGGSQSRPHEESSSSKDRAAWASSLYVDRELERWRQGGKPELRSWSAVMENQSVDFIHTEANSLWSEWPPSEKKSPPEDHDEVSSSLEGQSDNICVIKEDDMSVLACLPTEDVKAHNSGVHSGPVTSSSEAQAASSDTVEAAVKMNTVDKYTSPIPRVTVCDVMVGTEPALCMAAFTQTEDPETSDKHVITEVHMADLDYLAEEFIKLRMVKEELREQKEKMKSLSCRLKRECDCVQRAQQAELCLLALQYSMCTQHCWRLYYTSAEGGQVPPLPKNPPANIGHVVQKLESDYNQMRDKILAGVPLKELKPLSVDCEKITTGSRYIPAEIIGDKLGNVPSWCSQEPHNPSGEENGRPADQIRNGCQPSQRKEQSKKNCKKKTAVTMVPHDRDSVHTANKQEEAVCKELNTMEAWYDAEEDLEPAGSAVAAERGQDPAVVNKDVTNPESASGEPKCSVLCVSDLPSNVTESDVMLWFEKYHASEVSITALKNDLRVAIVTIGEPQSAEAAVRELNGCTMQGYTLHVEHIISANGGSHSQASAPIGELKCSQDDKPQTSKTESSSADRQLIGQTPPSSSIKIRKVVCISPTAKGTCVPQHYGTMGSFDTLMAELTQCHPDVGRQRIVDALVELRAKHQGILGSLPLRTIREMTSELLTRPASAAQL